MSLIERKGGYLPQKERKRRLARIAGLTLATSTLFAGPGILVMDKIVNSSNASTLDDNQGLTSGTYNGLDCPPVNPNTLEVVRRIFNTKDPQELKKVSPEKPNKYDKYVRQTAERFGVTLQDPNTAIDRLFFSETMEDALDGFNEFLSGFGYTATIPTETDDYDRYEGVSVVPNDELDPLKFAVGAYAAIEALQYLPIEVAKLAGNLEIRFVKFPLEDEFSQAIGLAANDPKRIYVDMNAFYFGNDFIIPHEIGHHIDMTTCGPDGFRVDSEYSSLNPQEFEYLGEDWVTVSDKEVVEFVESSYGMKNQIGDKAVLIEENITEAEGFGDMSPVLRSKFELIITRIEERAPRFAGYLRAISKKHDKK